MFQKLQACIRDHDVQKRWKRGLPSEDGRFLIEQQDVKNAL